MKKKNSKGTLVLLDFKTYYKSTVNGTEGYNWLLLCLKGLKWLDLNLFIWDSVRDYKASLTTSSLLFVRGFEEIDQEAGSKGFLKQISICCIFITHVLLKGEKKKVFSPSPIPEPQNWDFREPLIWHGSLEFRICKDYYLLISENI